MRTSWLYWHVAVFLVLGGVVLMAPRTMGPLGMRWNSWATLGLILGSCIVLGTMVRVDRQRRRQVELLLLEREAMNSGEFGHHFYGHRDWIADVAARLRDVLARHRQMNMDGLRPSDQLDEDLDLDVACNPDLFAGIAEEFEVSIANDHASLQGYAARIRTFDQLVDFVLECIDQSKA